MSRGAAFIVLIVAIVAIAGAVVLFAPAEENSDNGGDVSPGRVEYGITYVLNGGVLDDGAPSKYTSGKYTDLPVPENGDRFFEGWYTDEACTVPIGAILASVTGDQVPLCLLDGQPRGHRVRDGHRRVCGLVPLQEEVLRHDVLAVRGLQRRRILRPARHEPEDRRTGAVRRRPHRHDRLLLDRRGLRRRPRLRLQGERDDNRRLLRGEGVVLVRGVGIRGGRPVRLPQQLRPQDGVLQQRGQPDIHLQQGAHLRPGHRVRAPGLCVQGDPCRRSRDGGDRKGAHLDRLRLRLRRMVRGREALHRVPHAGRQPPHPRQGVRGPFHAGIHNLRGERAVLRGLRAEEPGDRHAGRRDRQGVRERGQIRFQPQRNRHARRQQRAGALHHEAVHREVCQILGHLGIRNLVLVSVRKEVHDLVRRQVQRRVRVHQQREGQGRVPVILRRVPLFHGGRQVRAADVRRAPEVQAAGVHDRPRVRRVRHDMRADHPVPVRRGVPPCGGVLEVPRRDVQGRRRRLRGLVHLVLYADEGDGLRYGADRFLRPCDGVHTLPQRQGQLRGRGRHDKRQEVRPLRDHRHRI
ncbi:MAG: InlB B-repeat-containing protein [Candidatus Methanomethylophilaceae archaeon]|nr:InlB B-repeat-containing protein [Candidatus Methanomethylophilaceae archaeon]